jgi:hypothetical protein
MIYNRLAGTEQFVSASLDPYDEASKNFEQ